MTAIRYTTCPSPAVANQLENALAGLAHDLEALRLPKLAAVVLGGGYGRGEGGVLHTPQGDRLYNDLDFFVFSARASRRERREIDQALATLSPKWQPKLQVAVDFGPAKNLAELPKVCSTLMYQELLRGWRLVWGSLDLAEYLPALAPDALPVTEAIRLLLNRGMGLLLAAERLSRKDSDHDFIVRNMHKSLLGSGDALLLATGRYAWRATDRQANFPKLATDYALPDEFVAGYEAACRYKCEPIPQLPPHPWEAWQLCRRCWLLAVQLVAGQRTADVQSVRAGLHQVAQAERSLRNFLRWTLHAHSLRSPRNLCDAPVVTVLGMLYDELLQEFPAAPLPPELLRLWHRFN